MSWHAPTGAAPTDYRVNWARSGEDYPSGTDDTANLHPTTTSQQLTDLDEGVELRRTPGMSYSASSHGTYTYANNYRNEADWCSDGHLTNRGLSPLDPAIPLGRDDPNSLPSPDGSEGQQALRDALDALAVAAGLSQAQIDAA